MEPVVWTYESYSTSDALLPADLSFLLQSSLLLANNWFMTSASRLVCTAFSFISFSTRLKCRSFMAIVSRCTRTICSSICSSTSGGCRCLRDPDGPMLPPWSRSRPLPPPPPVVVHTVSGSILNRLDTWPELFTT